MEWGPELTALRALRDDVLATTVEGRELVQTYYAQAPALVAAVHARPDARTIWQELFAGMVRPCADLARAGKAAEATALHRERVLALCDSVGVDRRAWTLTADPS